jgi:cytochrome P450
MTQPTVFQQILDYSNRANPYPLYAQLRKTPVEREPDGSYVVSTYREIVELLHDPRVSSNPRNRTQVPPGQGSEEAPGLPQSFIRLDPPPHDRLRRLAMRQFGPPHKPELLDSLRPEFARIVGCLIDGFQARQEVDIVDDFAYPLPVTVICELLGVPREDEPRFHAWAEPVLNAGDLIRVEDAAERERKSLQARSEAAQYFAELAEERRAEPRNDILSGLVTDDGPEGRMSQADLQSTALLLLIAGHETTVNLITNGTLTLLRQPEALARLRREPELIDRLVEELLRFEPPVHFLPNRAALADIEVGGTTIPKGSAITLVLASGSRDPEHVKDPDSFDPGRENNEHLGFGGGIHICFGAALARLEAQTALSELFRRLENPRLVSDAPPYRQNAFLRGPRHLPVAFDGVAR